MLFSGSITSMVIGAVAVLIALTFHELAHGLVAYLFGDPTAKNAGRLTLNPLAHLDPLGTLLLFVVGFGWAKPVPVNSFYFKGNRRLGIIGVSAAGPLSNLILAMLFSLFFPIIYLHGNTFWLSLLTNIIYLNIYFALFNLIPIPPLDGSHILGGLLSPQAWNQSKVMLFLQQYGFVLLMLLIFTGFIGNVIGPIAQKIFQLNIWLACSILL